VISPDDLNHRAATFIGIPLTSQRRPYPYRVSCEFQDRPGQVMLDQIQVMSPLRIVSKLGEVHPSELTLILDRLAEMFAP
jgi:mRNA interferase MazF